MHKKIFKTYTNIFFLFLLVIYLFSFASSQELHKIENVDNVIIISNPKNPIPKNGLNKRIIFKEELSIGVIEGDENYMFGRGIRFITDDNLNFYVSDLDNKRIQKYDQNGKYLLTIGRAGQGPGEFEFLSIPRFDSNDKLYVYDLVSQRISFFDMNGKFLRQISTPRMSFDLYINSKGLIIGAKREPLFEADNFKVITKFGLFDKDFKAIKILHKDEEENKILREGIGSINVPQMIFKPNICYTLDKNNFIYFGYPDKYEIDIYSPDGKLIKRISRDYEQRKVTKKDKTDYFKRMRAQDSILNIPEHLQKKMIKMTTFAKFKPAYIKFMQLENGWVFVVVDYTEDNQVVVDLFDKEGRYIAQFKTTVPTNNLFFKNGKAYAVAYENEFPFVKRYAIELQEYKNGKWVKSSIKLY